MSHVLGLAAATTVGGFLYFTVVPRIVEAFDTVSTALTVVAP